SATSLPVKTWTTPGRCSAALVSMLLMLAWACGLWSIAICTVWGRVISPVKMASPLSSGGSSRRLIEAPNTAVAMGLLASLSRQALDRIDGVLVHATAAHDAVEGHADLGLAGLAVIGEQLRQRQRHRR